MHVLLVLSRRAHYGLIVILINLIN